MDVRLVAALAVALGLAAALPTAAQAPSQPFDGLKKTIAVDTFQAAEAVGGTVTADGMTAMLTEALVKDGRFLVVERPGLGSIQNEQALAHGGATAGDAAASGHLIGASAIVRGAVTKYQAAAGRGHDPCNPPTRSIAAQSSSTATTGRIGPNTSSCMIAMHVRHYGPAYIHRIES